MANSNKCTNDALTRINAFLICCAYPENSCPNVIGTASCKCVRPIFTISFHSSLFCLTSWYNNCKFGINFSYTSYAVATLMAVGNESFELWLMFTWSFGWTNFDPNFPPNNSVARFEITSFTFMFVCVPLPVCQTTNGKWYRSNFPDITSNDACRIASAIFGSKFPSLSFTVAAACFTIPNACTNANGIFSPPIRKFSKLLCVCAPYNASAGTSTSPIVSVSILTPLLPLPPPPRSLPCLPACSSPP